MRALKRVLISYLAVCLSVIAVLTAPASAAEEKPKPQTLFTNVNVFDGKTDKLATGMNVLVEGNLIKKTGKGLKGRSDAKVIDGGGRTLMPGLIDSHTHLQLVAPLDQLIEMDWGEIGVRMAVIAKDQLMRGFTTVRDLCGNTHGLRNAINKGVSPGPRIISSGACITPRSGHGDFLGYNMDKGNSYAEKIGMVRMVDGPTEIRIAIREEFRKGASFIKLMMGGGLASAFDPLDVTTLQFDEVRAAVEETENWGTYATAHIYTDRGILMGPKAGMKTFEHTHLASKKVYQRFAKEGLTISAQIHAISQLVGYPSFTTAEQKRKAAYLAENGTATFGYIKELGVKAGFGADFWGDLKSQRINSIAIKGRKKYFSDAEILRQIYEHNVTLINMTGERLPYKDGPLGEISEGAYADIILVEGDPTKDVSILSDWENSIDLVMKDGTIYRNELK